MDISATITHLGHNKLLRLIVLILALMVLLVLVPSRSGEKDRIGAVVGGRDYDLFSWEVGNFFDKWLHEATELFKGDRSDNEKVALVREYFRLNGEITHIEFHISQVVTRNEGDLLSLTTRLDEIESRRNSMRDDVEKIVEGQVRSILSDEDLSWKLPFSNSDGYLFPPVDFRLDDSPRVLALSPRDEIRLLQTRLLHPNLTPDDIEDIEAGVEAEGDMSAIVTGVSAVATYPSVVSPSPSIQRVLRTVAHEWVHQYMLFFPLGQNFWDDNYMTTLNETIADAIGDYVGDRVYQTYYLNEVESSTQSTTTPPPVTNENTFDFRAEMRKTRVMTDDLLAEDKIEEAEQFMEERRQFMVENGFHFRKINQAFFAFNGSYAGNPASISPIGGQVQQVREANPSLKNFVKKVAQVSSYDEFLDLLNGD